MNWGLEIAKFIYCTAISALLFLFFTLVLDLIVLLVGGGWNPILGDWPIFSGTISVVYYGDKLMVTTLVICLGWMGRMVLGDRVPFFMASES